MALNKVLANVMSSNYELSTTDYFSVINMSEFISNLIQNTLDMLQARVDGDGNVVAPAEPAPIPEDLHGAYVETDISAPQDYTGKWGKICATNNVFNLRLTMIYRIWAAQNCPATIVPVTADHLRTAHEYVLIDIARWNVYTMLASAGINMTLRASDIVQDPLFNAAMINHLAPVATRWYENLNNNSTVSAQIAQSGYMLLHSFFANAIHRSHCNNHNWITADMHRTNSATRRCLAVLGSDIQNFSTFMERHGHETNHHLTTASLYHICDVLAGIVPATVPDVETIYADRDIRAKNVNEVLKVSESATDRWPAAQMGKSAMIIALNLIEAVYAHLSSVMKIDGADTIATGAASLSSWLKINTIDRAGMNMANLLLTHLVSNVYGYSCQANLIDPERYAALKSHAARNPASEASGKSVATSVMKATPHPEAISQAVRAMLSKMAMSISSVADSLQDADTGEIMTAFNHTAVSIEIGDTDQTKLQKLLEMVKGTGAEKKE
jgi:hypothetical protein